MVVKTGWTSQFNQLDRPVQPVGSSGSTGNWICVRFISLSKLAYNKTGKITKKLGQTGEPFTKANQIFLFDFLKFKTKGKYKGVFYYTSGRDHISY